MLESRDLGFQTTDQILAGFRDYDLDDPSVFNTPRSSDKSCFFEAVEESRYVWRSIQETTSNGRTRQRLRVYVIQDTEDVVLSRRDLIRGNSGRILCGQPRCGGQYFENCCARLHNDK